MRLTGASLTLPTCCLGTSSPDLGSGVPGPEGRGFGGVLSWWVACIFLRQRGPHRTPAPQALPCPVVKAQEGEMSKASSGCYHRSPPAPSGGEAIPPFSSLLAPRASAAAALFDLKRNPQLCGWSVTKSCPTLCNPRDCGMSGSSGLPVSCSVLKFMSIESW